LAAGEWCGMASNSEQVLLRFYLRTADRAPFAPTYERIVKAARHEGLAGATVLKGIMGYGSHGQIEHSAWTLSEHLPAIVEIIDTGERLIQFINGALEAQLHNALATLERAAVMRYTHRASVPSPRLQISEMLKPLSTLPRIEPRDHMTISTDGVLLRVFIGESDRHEHRPLYEAILRRARELGLSGATVLRGVEGFGANSVVHRASLLEMSTDLPIVIEIVDTEEKIKRLLPDLEQMVNEGMITMEYVVILMYRHTGSKAP
jgi:PII-like signaling protein